MPVKSNMNSMKFVDYVETLNLDSCFTPTCALVGHIIGGPSGVTTGLVHVYVQDHMLGAGGTPYTKPIGATQIVLSDDAVNFRRYSDGGYGEWVAIAGGSGGGDSGLSTKVTTLEGKVTTLEGKASAHDAYEARIAALEALIDSTKAAKWNGYDARITALEGAGA